MTPPPQDRRWLWYFLVLGVLGGLFVIGLFVFSRPPQLTPQELSEALHRWEQKGPHDYNMVYTKSGSATGRFEVEVRKGRVRRVLMDGRPLESRLYSSSSMEGLFKDLEDFLAIKQKTSGSRIFLRARFDPDDGHLLHYVYSDPNMHQSVEVEVTTFQPLSAGLSPDSQEFGRAKHRVARVLEAHRIRARSRIRQQPCAVPEPRIGVHLTPNPVGLEDSAHPTAAADKRARSAAELRPA